jgi:hypothetical protein
MNHTFKVYAFYFCAPLMALFALSSSLNAVKNSSAARNADGRAKILMEQSDFVAKRQAPSRQKAQIQSDLKSALNLAILAKNFHNREAFRSVAWLLLDLGLLSFCLIMLNQYQQQYIPTAPGND